MTCWPSSIGSKKFKKSDSVARFSPARKTPYRDFLTVATKRACEVGEAVGGFSNVGEDDVGTQEGKRIEIVDRDDHCPVTG